jgi:hypothetical protein
MQTNNAGNELEKAADLTDIKVGDTFGFEQKFTEKNQQRLVKANPNPTLDRSLERENLIRRYEFLNDQNKIFYVYLIDYGKVMGYYTAKGKISSVNSRLTQEEQVIRGKHGCCDSNKNVVVGSPQLDGSYGTNGDGIFFFTTEGAYVEWNGMYLVSDFPLSMQTPPMLIQEV